MGRGKRERVVGRVGVPAGLAAAEADAGADELHVETVVDARRYRVSRCGGSWPVVFQAAEWDGDDHIWFNPVHRSNATTKRDIHARCYDAIRAAFAEDAATWKRAKKRGGTVHLWAAGAAV